MSAGLALGCGSFSDSIRTKADAMKFALEATVKFTDCTKVYQYDKAKELFEFFCTNVDLAESESISVSEIIDPVFEKLKEFSESQNKCNCKCRCRDGS